MEIKSVSDYLHTFLGEGQKRRPAFSNPHADKMAKERRRERHEASEKAKKEADREIDDIFAVLEATEKAKKNFSKKFKVGKNFFKR